MTAVIVGALLAGAGGVLLAELALHPPRRPVTHAERAARMVSADYSASLKNVTISAADGALLQAWYIKPAHDNGMTVLLLHGVADNREGAAGYGRIFLPHGYRVLAPDSRAHGESGGAIATYGLEEADDVHRWVSWLYQNDPPGCVYGLGESMGAAILLQSLEKEARFCAVIAESSFDTFREIAYERVGQYTGLGPWFQRTLGRIPVETAFWYARMRYGVDLRDVSPKTAVEHSQVPILLIHGAADTNIPPHESEELESADQAHAQLWIVPNAGHTGAWAADPPKFESTVLSWFEQHKSSAVSQQ